MSVVIVKNLLSSSSKHRATFEAYWLNDEFNLNQAYTKYF